MFPGKPDGNRAEQIEQEIRHKGNALSDSCGISRPCDSQGGEEADSEYHQRVQDDIRNTGADHAGHGNLHLSCGLEQFLEKQSQRDDGREQKCSVCILQRSVCDFRI